jgi:hypothetical protein
VKSPLDLELERIDVRNKMDSHESLCDRITERLESLEFAAAKAGVYEYDLLLEVDGEFIVLIVGTDSPSTGWLVRRVDGTLTAYAAADKFADKGRKILLTRRLTDTVKKVVTLLQSGPWKERL